MTDDELKGRRREPTFEHQITMLRAKENFEREKENKLINASPSPFAVKRFLKGFDVNTEISDDLVLSDRNLDHIKLSVNENIKDDLEIKLKALESKEFKTTSDVDNIDLINKKEKELFVFKENTNDENYNTDNLTKNTNTDLVEIKEIKECREGTNNKDESDLNFGNEEKLNINFPNRLTSDNKLVIKSALSPKIKIEDKKISNENVTISVKSVKLNEGFPFTKKVVPKQSKTKFQ